MVTLGRSTRDASLPLPRGLLEARGFAVEEVERGGDVTVHAPGQLVGYPILDLTGHREDVHWYLRQIEEALIRSLGPFGIEASRHPGYTGVWTGGRKIASIGIHVKRWVTLHGFALNVTTDLSVFDLVVPCGIEGVVMTSIERETGGRADGRTGSSLWERQSRHGDGGVGRGVRPRTNALARRGGRAVPAGERLTAHDSRLVTHD